MAAHEYHLNLSEVERVTLLRLLEESLDQAQSEDEAERHGTLSHELTLLQALTEKVRNLSR